MPSGSQGDPPSFPFSSFIRIPDRCRTGVLDAEIAITRSMADRNAEKYGVGIKLKNK
jgi:hypothetical protein